MKAVRFGPHAVKKFNDLGRYNVTVTREQVEEAVSKPDYREASKKGRMIATRGFTEHHEAFEIVTFYPGRRSRYEDPVRQG